MGEKNRHLWVKEIPIIAYRVMPTRKQSGVRQILRVCKKRVRMSAVNTRSQNPVRNNSIIADHSLVSVA